MTSGRPTSVIAALQMAASLSSAVSAMRLDLERRAAQTNATCPQEYTWAETQWKSRTPCEAAADVLAPCNGGNWLVRDLTVDIYYSNPGTEKTVANPCSCSWAAYNLLSACSDCQGVPQAVRMWPDYSHLCPVQFLGAGTYYPRDYLLGDISIPFWATTDPTKWTGQRYNGVQAKGLAIQHNPDIRPPAPRDKNLSIGPILGGVIGGLVALSVSARVIYLLVIRRRQLRARNAAVDLNAGGNDHQRSASHNSTIPQTSMTQITLNGPDDFITPFNLPVQKNVLTVRPASIRKNREDVSARSDSPNTPAVRVDDPLVIPDPPPPGYSPNPAYASIKMRGSEFRRGHPSTSDHSGSSIFTSRSDIPGDSLTRSVAAQQTTHTNTPSYPRNAKRRPREEGINLRDIG